MDKTCSFYLGKGPSGVEGMGTALSHGWQQPVLDSTSKEDYLCKVKEAIEIPAKRTWHDTDCAFTWHEGSLYAQVRGRWEVVTPEIRKSLGIQD